MTVPPAGRYGSSGRTVVVALICGIGAPSAPRHRCGKAGPTPSLLEEQRPEQHDEPRDAGWLLLIGMHERCGLWRGRPLRKPRHEELLPRELQQRDDVPSARLRLLVL